MVGSVGERRALVGAAIATVGSLVTIVGTFLPWLRSGTRNRSSYTIFDLVERLGFAPGGFVAWSLRLWPFVPLLMVVISITCWAAPIERRLVRPLAVLAAVATVWIGGTGLAVLAAPAAGLFRIGPGPAITVLGVLVAATGSAATALTSAGVSRRGSVASEAA